MNKKIDKNFSLAILILVGALIIFSFWFLTNSMKDDYNQALTVPNFTNPKAQDTTSSVNQELINDPVLKEVSVDGIILETTDDIAELDSLSDIEEIDFDDVNF